MGGCVVPEWIEAQALDNLVSQEQMSVTVNRPELADYGLKLMWSKHRWNTHMAKHRPSRSPQTPHQNGTEMEMSSRPANAQEPSLLWLLQRQCAKLAAGGDWDCVNVLNGAIMSLAKGNGKGKGTAEGDIGAKGASPKSAGKDGDGFDVERAEEQLTLCGGSVR